MYFLLKMQLGSGLRFKIMSLSYVFVISHIAFGIKIPTSKTLHLNKFISKLYRLNRDLM